MKALVLGIGLQGKAVIHDLEQSPLVTQILAADLDVVRLAEYIRGAGYRKVVPVAVDAGNEAELVQTIRGGGVQIVICMVPPALGYQVARAALEAGVPFVSSSYTGMVQELDGEARARDITILPEMGMDPGIDLILGSLAVGELDQVQGFHSYGAGIPAAGAADNPLRYKITWTFDGLLKAYKRPARVLRGGREIFIPGTEIFGEEHMHLLDIPGLGTLEAYPNGDALHYRELFGIGPGLTEMGRFALRWPGHCRFWFVMAQLGFLDDEPVAIEGALVSPRQFLVHHLGPRLQFRQGERDVVILRAQAWGVKAGKRRKVTYDLFDYRDLETGLFAMNRTVGFTVSIAAQLVLAGKITAKGVLSPVRQVPARLVLEELQKRGMEVHHRVEDLDPSERKG
jgi:saccharopine dehydrogenase-like NADP-dependent oxidoreductase